MNAENYVASYKDWRLWSEECHCAVLIHVQTLNVWPQVTEKTYMAAPADKARQCGVYTWSQARDRSVIPKLLHLHFSFLLVPNCFCQSHSPIGHSSHFLHELFTCCWVVYLLRLRDAKPRSCAFIYEQFWTEPEILQLWYLNTQTVFTFIIHHNSETLGITLLART